MTTLFRIEKLIPRKRFVHCAALIVGILAASPARASFHIMRISEALGQYRGDPRIQFVELQMANAGQSLVSGHKILFQDSNGRPTGQITLTRDVSNGANGSNILIGTQEFADAFDVPVDFLLPEGLMPPYSGRVCFDGIDCLTYGNAAAPDPDYGSPAPRFLVDGARSLTLLNVTPPGPGRNNSLDYAPRDPTPRNNSGGAGGPPAFACHVEDSFADLSQWNPPSDGAGLDVETCAGKLSSADVGLASVAGNALILTPGTASDSQFGGPICLAGLKRSAAQRIPGDSYRVKLEVLARPGMESGACFVRAKHGFDEATRTLDLSRSSALGIRFGFDDAAAANDRLRADVRLPCWKPGQVDGMEEASYAGFEVSSGSSYTIVLDVDGDDGEGPLTLQAKLFPSSEAEPIDYLATFDVSNGLNAADDAELEHAVLLAASGTHEGALEVRNFSVCPIPRNQKHVRDVSCVRIADGSICAFWSNPADAEANEPILIAVNGRDEVALAGAATEHTILNPPDGELTVSITNYSGIAATCTVCENNLPEIVIGDPGPVALAGGTATIPFDSSASTDGDQGLQTLSRFWEILSTPPEGNASFDDPGAVVLHLNVNAPGDYTVQLTITDSGCQGDTGQTSFGERTVTVSRGGPAGLQKPGDANQDGRLDLSDAVAVLGYLFTGASAGLACGDGSKTDPANLALLDLNADGRIDLSDPVRLLGYLFLGAPRPDACSDDTCPCIAIEGCAESCK